MSFNYLTLCCSLLLPSIFLRIRAFSNVVALCITWPKYWRIFMLSLFSHSVVSNSLWPHVLQHARIPCPSPPPGVYSNSCPLSQGWYLTISSSATLFFYCLQSFPASGSIPMSYLFASGGQSIGASASASVLPMNIQNWFPLGLTGLISLQSKRFSRAFSCTTIQKHQFFGVQLSLWSDSFIHTWLLKKP